MLRKEIPVKSHKGIRKILIWDKELKRFIEPKTGAKFRATKSIKGQRSTKSFNTLREAINWKNTYSNIQVPTSTPLALKDNSPYLKDLYSNYLEIVSPTIEKSTLANKLEKANFLKVLFRYRMNEITPELIDKFIRDRKAEAVITSIRRCNFDRELDELRAVINWYIENHDYKFPKPLLRRHYSLGVIKKSPEKNKKMSPEEVTLFFNAIKEYCGTFYYDFAITQFYTAGRVQEIAGLQKQCVNFNKRQVEIKYVTVWNKQKHFDYLKAMPKNDEIRYCQMSKAMYKCLLRRCGLIPRECNFVFHNNGLPLKYREIQFNYEKALKECALFPKYSGTHFLRHTMASITRNVTGSIDYTQAVTGHKDIRYVQHYAGTPDNKQKVAVAEVEEHMDKILSFEKLSTRTQTHADQNLEPNSLVIYGS